jgi:Uma2 family endonuclease
MATDTAFNDPHAVIPVMVIPDLDHLVTEDDTPVDNIFSEKQQRLLTESLHTSWVASGQNRTFVVLANVGLFFATRRPPLVPDVLLSMDVELPADLQPKNHRSYFVWEYGKAPDVVIEIVSNREGGEDSEKLAAYARIGVRYYAIFDPYEFLSAEKLRIFRLDATEFHKMDEPVWFSGVGLGLRLWQGRYEDHDGTWLRWVDDGGLPILTGRERSERLAEQLRKLGAEPVV